MKRVAVTLVTLLLAAPALALGAEGAQAGPENKPCENLTLALKLPKQVSKKKQPVRVKVEDVDAVFQALEDGLQGHVCRLFFRQLFEVKQKKESEVVFFPITQRVLRTVPESSLKGLPLFDAEGKEIGVYESRVLREKSGDNYRMPVRKTFGIQFKNPAGEYESSGWEFLGENYLLRWTDLKNQVALVSE